jgi:hypothetical protein
MSTEHLPVRSDDRPPPLEEQAALERWIAEKTGP